MSLQQLIINGLTNIATNKGDLLSTIQGAINDGNYSKDVKWIPSVDIVDTQNSLYVYLDIAGVLPTSIYIDVLNNKLSIAGEKIKKYTSDSDVITNEIIYGKFVKYVTIPISITNKDNIVVSYTDGLLTLVIDKNKERENRFVINLCPVSSDLRN